MYTYVCIISIRANALLEVVRKISLDKKIWWNVLVYECDFNHCLGRSCCGWSHEIRNRLWLLVLLFCLIEMSTERLIRILNALSKVRVLYTPFCFPFQWWER